MNENEGLEPARRDQTLRGSFIGVGRRPRILLLLLAAWSVLALLSHVFVNSGLFLDIQDMELDGALGGFALGFNALPMAVLYLYCWRDPQRYRHVFWLALIQQAAMASGAMYQLVIGTFSVESVIVPAVGSGVLAFFSFLQVFEPETPPAA